MTFDLSTILSWFRPDDFFTKENIMDRGLVFYTEASV